MVDDQEKAEQLEALAAELREMAEHMAQLSKGVAGMVKPAPVAHIIAGSMSEGMAWARRTGKSGPMRFVTDAAELGVATENDIVYALRSARVTNEDAIRYWESTGGAPWVEVGTDDVD